MGHIPCQTTQTGTVFLTKVLFLFFLVGVTNFDVYMINENSNK